MKKILCKILPILFLLPLLTVAASAAPPSYAKLGVDGTVFRPGQIVTFNISSDGNSNTLWIYGPDGSTNYYQNLTTSFQIAFEVEGTYEALVQAWNGDGSAMSDLVSFTVSSAPAVDPGPTFENSLLPFVVVLLFGITAINLLSFLFRGF